MGSNNQTANFTISMNSDMIVVASSQCTTCVNKFYNPSSSTTDVTIASGLNYTNTDFSNFTLEYSNASYGGSVVQDKVCLKSAAQ